ncbi:MAG TPA: cation diffusion facilitator family transporter [Acidobacteriaceae bacterium]|jgi:cation diffusion facilitator family transporter|nr:cation diffusion facilitator family transporter [Acidobacteriaceae bacterium]
MPSAAIPGSSEAAAEKRWAALISVAAACAMTALKATVGLLTGSLGVLSDAVHSALDLVGAAMTFVSVRVSDRPADWNHPYGHAKVENISAFVETGLMAASAVGISAEAISRIFFRPVTLRYSIWPFLVMGASMGVDLWRSRELRRVAERHKSAALEADALHFASDIWTSVAVVVGLSASWLGTVEHLPWLRYADPLAALAVSIMILIFGWRLAWRAVFALTDAVPPELHTRMIEEVGKTDGVLGIDQARVRRSGHAYFADVTLSLSRHLTFQRTEDLVRDATAAVQRVLPDADVVIHTVPRSTIAESLFDQVRAVAARNNVLLHDVSIEAFADGLHVEQHIEVKETMPLLEAHRFVYGIEQQIRREVPQVGSVLTHIESEPGTIEAPVRVEQDRHIEQCLRDAAVNVPGVVDIHEVNVDRVGERLHVTCHCTLPDGMEMRRVHESITELEHRFKLDCPEVDRVLIHPEPASDNQHRQ